MAASPLPLRGPKRGRNCCVTPAFSGVHSKRDKIKSGCIGGKDKIVDMQPRSIFTKIFRTNGVLASKTPLNPPRTIFKKRGRFQNPPCYRIFEKSPPPARITNTETTRYHNKWDTQQTYNTMTTSAVQSQWGLGLWADSATHPVIVQAPHTAIHISLGDIQSVPTWWVLAFFPGFLNFSSDAPKYRSLGGGGYVYFLKSV